MRLHWTDIFIRCTCMEQNKARTKRLCEARSVRHDALRYCGTV
jgi:hypothetical protein